MSIHKHGKNKINETVDDGTIVGSVTLRPESLISNLINNNNNESEEYESQNISSSSDSN